MTEEFDIRLNNPWIRENDSNFFYKTKRFYAFFNKGYEVMIQLATNLIIIQQIYPDERYEAPIMIRYDLFRQIVDEIEQEKTIYE
jgi:hypothetical protein